MKKYRQVNTYSKILETTLFEHFNAFEHIHTIVDVV